MNEEKRFKLNAREGYEYYYDWQRLKQEVLQSSLSSVAEFRVYDWQNNQLRDGMRRNGFIWKRQICEVVLISLFPSCSWRLTR
jgi:hypothetical protein